MSVQRKLNALLFELQAARSPLAQAKILARSWRTLRELSPTDRRLLARHAGFDGAEQILEGLAGKQKLFSPAALLQLLDHARTTDGAAVTEMVDALRDPSQRKEALSRGAGMAVDLLSEDNEEEVPEEISEALGELHSVERDVLETPEEALAALAALEGETKDQEAVKSSGSAASDDGGEAEPIPTQGRSASDEGHHGLPRKEATPSPKAPRPAPRRVVPPMPEWDHLNGGAAKRDQPEAAGEATGGTKSAHEKTPAADVQAVLEALGAETSAFSRLRALDRELDGFRRSKVATLERLLEAFPSGWVRRRALAALISAGIPDSDTQALDLIAGLENEVDRRWCLGALAQRGDLKGTVLQRSLDLVSSPAGRRRLQILSERG